MKTITYKQILALSATIDAAFSLNAIGLDEQSHVASTLIYSICEELLDKEDAHMVADELHNRWPGHGNTTWIGKTLTDAGYEIEG